MSKEAAMSMMTGQTVTSVNPSLVTGAIPPGEAPPTDTAAIPPAQNLDSDRFAKIAAREARIVKEREALKAEQIKIAEERGKIQAFQKEYEEFENLKKTDKIAAMKKAGFTEEDIFNFLAGKDEKEPTPEEKAAAAAQAEIKKFRDEQLAEEQKRQAERDDRAIKNFKGEIPKMISKEVEKYEYCNHNGVMAEEIVYETILGLIGSEPTLTPHQAMKEALEMVEKMYEDEDKAMSTLKKRQPAPQVNQVDDEPAAKPILRTQAQQRARTPAAPTITQKATATVASTIPKGKETPSQKRERLENWLKTGIKS